MTNLQPCMECGALISKSAWPCPRCKTHQPQGVHCSVCGDESTPISEKEALSRTNEHRIRWYHPECAKRILSIPADALCRDCRTALASFWNWEAIFKATDRDDKSCLNCGAKSVLAKDGMNTGCVCIRCGLPLLSFHELDGLYHASCNADSKKEVKEILRRHTEDSLRREQEDAGRARGGCSGMILILLSLLVSIELFFS